MSKEKMENVTEAEIVEEIGLSDDDKEVMKALSTEIKDKDFIGDLKNAQSNEYCSLEATTQAEKLSLFNAISDPKPLSDLVNSEIVVSNVYMKVAELKDEDTGEYTNAPAIVLITPENEAYRCVSVGVYNDLSQIFAMLGEPKDWEEPITFEVKYKTLNSKGWKMLKLTARV